MDKDTTFFMPPTIGIVVPCYNESARLPVQAFLDFIAKYQTFVFCFVNDGSKDNTAAILQQMHTAFPERISIIDRRQNKGKGESIREGINYLMTHYPITHVGFLDADLATPLSEMQELANIIKQNCYSMVCGSRIKRMGANIERYAIRHIIGRFFATLISWSLRLPFYDTQCGAKLFSVEDVHQGIFDTPFISRWLVDVEIIKRLQKKMGYEKSYHRIYEYPLREWRDVGRGTRKALFCVICVKNSNLIVSGTKFDMLDLNQILMKSF
ncbi:MAG: glycosyltransferase [Bacteroidia bacterium]|nr:glycosyltransferase [Bacteroidia bacterium]